MHNSAVQLSQHRTVMYPSGCFPISVLLLFLSNFKLVTTFYTILLNILFMFSSDFAEQGSYSN